MRKLQIFLLFLVGGVLLAIWSPWNNWNFSFAQIFGIEAPSEVAGLQVSSLAGELEVFLDNVSIGRTTSDPQVPLVYPGIDPGEHQVRIVRKSELNNAFIEFNKLLRFIESTDIVIGYELGPSSEFSEGHIISVSRNTDSSSETFLNVNSEPAQAKVLIDGISAGETPVVLLPITLNEQHTITLQKDGYETQTFTILPKEQSDREKLKGLTLDIDGTLFLQPLQVKR